MANFTYTWKASTPTGTLSYSSTYSASSVIDVEETIAALASDFQVFIAIDVTALKAIYIVADAAMTLETNNGTTPDDTLTLVANVPYIWNTDSYDTCKLTVDVTSIFFTSTPGGTIIIRGIQDATP